VDKTDDRSGRRLYLPEINARNKMRAQAAELSIPLLVEAGVGNNWDEAH
jgi:DNA polymerase I-like protein with 3'-5' exonuclease and polymerase domains